MAPALPMIGKAVVGTVVGGAVGEGVKAIVGGPDPVMPPTPAPNFGSDVLISALQQQRSGVRDLNPITGGQQDITMDLARRFSMV